MCMLPHHMSNPSVSSHANSASTEDPSSGGPPQPFPRHDVHDRVLSNHPTEDPYIKKSVCLGLLNGTQRCFFVDLSEFLTWRVQPVNCTKFSEAMASPWMRFNTSRAWAICPSRAMATAWVLRPLVSVGWRLK